MPRGSRGTSSVQRTRSDARSTAVSVCVQADVTYAVAPSGDRARPHASAARGTRAISTRPASASGRSTSKRPGSRTVTRTRSSGKTSTLAGAPGIATPCARPRAGTAKTRSDRSSSDATYSRSSCRERAIAEPSRTSGTVTAGRSPWPSPAPSPRAAREERAPRTSPPRSPRAAPSGERPSRRRCYDTGRPPTGRRRVASGAARVRHSPAMRITVWPWECPSPTCLSASPTPSSA